MANDNFDSSQKNTIWEKYFGKSYTAVDEFGRPMTKDKFDADHILPIAKGGETKIENGFPLSSLSNEEKSDECNGIINGHSFKVKEVTKGIGQFSVDGSIVSK